MNHRDAHDLPDPSPAPGNTTGAARLGCLLIGLQVVALLAAVIGFIPLIGVPFAIAALVVSAGSLLGARALPSSKAVTVAIALGVLGLLFGLLALAAHGSPGYDHWSFG